jgi:putative oxidoreductase
MATATTHHDSLDEPTLSRPRVHDASRVLPLAGRVLLAAIFIMSAPNNFTDQDIAYAASQGVPMASALVPLAGVIALVGGLCVLFGFRTKTGAWLLIAFLVPVTLVMHRFWGLADAHAAQMQTVQFMKNLGLIGGALFLAYFGAGPLSVDAKLARRAATVR